MIEPLEPIQFQRKDEDEKEKERQKEQQEKAKQLDNKLQSLSEDFN